METNNKERKRNKELIKVLDWVRELGGNKVHVKEEEGSKELRLSLFTDRHEYKILSHPRTKSASYLGCIVYNRAPEPGEEHLRCSDLADGRLSRETWERIKSDIISTELLPVLVPADRPRLNQ